MEIQEVQALFTRIKELHPHTPPDKIPKLTHREAQHWADSLNGYSLEQAIKAAEAHAGSCRFWPALSEIKAHLPPAQKEDCRRFTPPTPSELRALELSRAWQRTWHEELRRRGLPTMAEAVRQGIPFGKWAELVADVDSPTAPPPPRQ